MIVQGKVGYRKHPTLLSLSTLPLPTARMPLISKYGEFENITFSRRGTCHPRVAGIKTGCDVMMIMSQMVACTWHVPHLLAVHQRCTPHPLTLSLLRK